MYVNIIIAVLFLGLHIYDASSFPLSGEEAYYWTWSQHWSWGYWHHPPMIAYGIGFVSATLPKTEITIRLFGIVLHIFSSLMLSIQTKRPTQTLLLLLTLPGLSVIAIEAHPQIYFYSFLSFALWSWLSHRWILLGIFCCLCFLSTTSAIFLVFFLGLIGLFYPQHRKGVFIAFIISMLGIIPWTFWLFSHTEFPLGLLYNMDSDSIIIAGLDLFLYVGGIVLTPFILPKQQDQKIMWLICVSFILSISIFSPQFMGIGWGVVGTIYICRRISGRPLSILLGFHMFIFGIQKINLHIPLLPSDVHVAQKYNGGEILADAVHAWDINDVWTTSPFDAAWIRFYCDVQAHTNESLGSKSQFDLWDRSFPDSGLMIQEHSRFFSVPGYHFSNIQTIASYANSYKEGEFVQTHQWNTAVFQLSANDETFSPNNDAD
ncbi:MAG: hypothetical protein CL916_07120 [Deltaproteobacteria bacterium]|nr:hypothetical protein [Deltaproteobacteria bacterium]